MEVKESIEDHVHKKRNKIDKFHEEKEKKI